MRIYVANKGDTLRKIASVHGLLLQQIIAVNPHISGPDSPIEGSIVNVPVHPAACKTKLAIPFCPGRSEEDLINSWVTTTPIEQMENTEYDILIIGTGAGGGAALWRLCEKLGGSGKKIGIIDRGDLLLQTNASNIPTLAWRMFDYFGHPEISEPVGSMDFPGARLFYALGGKTIIWNAVTPRVYSGKLLDWPVPMQEMDLYYDIAEQLMDVSLFPSPASEAMRSSLQQGGFPGTAYMPIAAVPIIKGNRITRGVYYSSLVSIAQARQLASFDLAVNARAVQILTEGNAAVAVRVMTPDKRSYVVRAKKIVLSCSTFETPRLLMASGIGNRALGHYLTNHSSVQGIAGVSISSACRPFIADMMPIELLIPQNENRPFQIQINSALSMMGEPGGQAAGSMKYYFTAFGQVEPQFRNQMFLNPNVKDEYGVPTIQINFSYSRQDQEVVLQMVEAMRRIAQTLQYDEFTMPKCQTTPGTDIHEAGTCRIGNDPQTSAADSYGQVRGISGVYVADNSMLPAFGAANPTLTTVALSIRVADYIAGQLD